MIKTIESIKVKVDNVIFTVDENKVHYVLDYNVCLNEINEKINFYLYNYDYVIVMFKTNNQDIINHYYDKKLFRSNKIKKVDVSILYEEKETLFYKIIVEDEIEDFCFHMYNHIHLLKFLRNYSEVYSNNEDINYILASEEVYKIVNLKGKTKRIFKNRDSLLKYVIENPNPFNLEYIYVDEKIREIDEIY